MKNDSKRTLILITQHFWPSAGATSQLVTDLAIAYANAGIPVLVLTQKTINTANQPFLSDRVSIQQLGLSSKYATPLVKKLTDAVLFFLHVLIWTILYSGTKDIHLIVSNPPFMALIGPIVQAFKKFRYIFLLQDVFPLSAAVAGIIPARGPVYSFFNMSMAYACNQSSGLVVLNESMAKSVTQEFNYSGNLDVIHNWAVEKATDLTKQRNPIALKWGLENKFVVQYSGNFGQLHDIYTILESTRLLSFDKNIVFLFIGEGCKKDQIIQFQNRTNSSNIILKPYQDRDLLPFSLACADISIISMRPGAERIVAPSKLYGILASGKPLLVLGSKQSSIAHLIKDHNCGFTIENGDPVALAHVVKRLSLEPHLSSEMGRASRALYEAKLGLDKSFQRYFQITHGKI